MNLKASTEVKGARTSDALQVGEQLVAIKNTQIDLRDAIKNLTNEVKDVVTALCAKISDITTLIKVLIAIKNSLQDSGTSK